jgi:hypothetical protein
MALSVFALLAQIVQLNIVAWRSVFRRVDVPDMCCQLKSGC